MKLKTEDPLKIRQRRRLLIAIAAIALIALLIAVPFSQYQSAQRMQAKETLLATIAANALETAAPPTAAPED